MFKEKVGNFDPIKKNKKPDKKVTTLVTIYE